MGDGAAIAALVEHPNEIDLLLGGPDRVAVPVYGDIVLVGIDIGNGFPPGAFGCGHLNGLDHGESCSD